MITRSSRHNVPLYSLNPTVLLNDPEWRNKSDVQSLFDLLLEIQQPPECENGISMRKGKKRASPSDVDKKPDCKRQKLNQEMGVVIAEPPEAEGHKNNGMHTQNDTIPVLVHKLEITPSTSCLDQATIESSTSTLNSIINDETSPEVRFDLGQCMLEEGHSGIHITVKPGSTSSITELTLHLPPINDWGDGPDAYSEEFSPSCQDLIRAMTGLRDQGQLSLEARLCAFVLSAPSLDGHFALRLEIVITASLLLPAIFEPVPDKRRMLSNSKRRFLELIFPRKNKSEQQPTVNIPYLFSILGPAPALVSQELQNKHQPKELIPKLLPFQLRSVAWLLSREGKKLDDDGAVVPKDDGLNLPFQWDKIDINGYAPIYIDRLFGEVSPNPPEVLSPPCALLAEEPGLGKTLESIALIMLNPAPKTRTPTNSMWDEDAGLRVKEVKTTLIVTPPSLAQQWADELGRHAPTLKVLNYHGWSNLELPTTHNGKEGRAKAMWDPDVATWLPKGVRPCLNTKDLARDNVDMDHDKHTEQFELPEGTVDWASYVNSFDVCITTYNILTQDLAVARAPPIRPRRSTAAYPYRSLISRPRSPLVMCEFHRVIMDKVQQQGGGKAEEMVSLIPRVRSLAVSGTPARATIADLFHVLKFLRLSDQIGSLGWKRLRMPEYADLFKRLFNQICIRTMKKAVKDELTIPQQTRYLVAIELGAVERAVYDEQFEAALQQLGLDALGVARAANWLVDPTVLRALIRKLRGICTHPQVGELLPRDKVLKPGVLKSMAEVLENMADSNWRNIMDDRRGKISLLIRRAQLVQHEKNRATRYVAALDLLLEAETETISLLEDIKSAIAQHDTKGELLKAEAAALQGKQNAHDGSDDELMRNMEEEADPEILGLPKTSAGKAHRDKRIGLRNRLREVLMILHRVKFFEGDVYHVLGAGKAAEEDAAYSAAEKIRRDLLSSAELAATSVMEEISSKASKTGLEESALMIPEPYCEQGGIRSLYLTTEMNDIITIALNPQVKLLWKWRLKLHELLSQKLTSDDDQADGQEYTRSLDVQSEAEVYLQAYASILADRREMLVAERTLLATHNAREKKGRKTKTSATTMLEDVSVALAKTENGEPLDVRLEHEVLLKNLNNERRELLLGENDQPHRPVRTITMDLNSASARITSRNDPEKLIIEQVTNSLRKLISSQSNLLDKLEQDLVWLRKAFNSHVQYFRQLQDISDSVAEVEFEGLVADAIRGCVIQTIQLDDKIKASKARQRYLEHLTKDNAMDDDDGKCCILCRCDFIRGFITQCAHVFCETCMKAWLKRPEGKVCPVCRVIVDTNKLQRFVVGVDELPPQIVNNEIMPISKRKIAYNRIGEQDFAEIQRIETIGSYGNKIQTLVRHLLYLQKTDPEAKSIIFSAWSDSLHIVEHALLNNGIRCLRIDQGAGSRRNVVQKFTKDPTIKVLLLHGERQNAGLNVTVASRVFLLESVVNHGFEVQAIARIDRMGQRRSTEVYCYYAEDTIERNILDLAARQGLSLYTTENSFGTLNVSPKLMRESEDDQGPKTGKKKNKGDFISRTEDMLAILLPHLFEDPEYLISDDDEADALAEARTSGSWDDEDGNAVAGPSRLA